MSIYLAVKNQVHGTPQECNDSIVEALEALVDEADVATVAELLAEVCHEKAEHLFSNWQDRKAAALYTRAGQRLITAAARIEKYGV